MIKLIKNFLILQKSELLSKKWLVKSEILALLLTYVRTPLSEYYTEKEDSDETNDEINEGLCAMDEKDIEVKVRCKACMNFTIFCHKVIFKKNLSK